MHKGVTTYLTCITFAILLPTLVSAGTCVCGFNAYTHCKDDTLRYISQCFDTDTKQLCGYDEQILGSCENGNSNLSYVNKTQSYKFVNSSSAGKPIEKGISGLGFPSIKLSSASKPIETGISLGFPPYRPPLPNPNPYYIVARYHCVDRSNQNKDRAYCDKSVNATSCDAAANVIKHDWYNLPDPCVVCTTNARDDTRTTSSVEFIQQGPCKGYQVKY